MVLAIKSISSNKRLALMLLSTTMLQFTRAASEGDNDYTVYLKIPIECIRGKELNDINIYKTVGLKFQAEKGDASSLVEKINVNCKAIMEAEPSKYIRKGDMIQSIEVGGKQFTPKTKGVFGKITCTEILRNKLRKFCNVKDSPELRTLTLNIRGKEPKSVDDEDRQLAEWFGTKFIKRNWDSRYDIKNKVILNDLLQKLQEDLRLSKKEASAVVDRFVRWKLRCLNEGNPTSNTTPMHNKEPAATGNTQNFVLEEKAVEQPGLMFDVRATRLAKAHAFFHEQMVKFIKDRAINFADQDKFVDDRCAEIMEKYRLKRNEASFATLWGKSCNWFNKQINKKINGAEASETVHVDSPQQSKESSERMEIVTSKLAERLSEKEKSDQRESPNQCNRLRSYSMNEKDTMNSDSAERNFLTKFGCEDVIQKYSFVHGEPGEVSAQSRPRSNSVPLWSWTPEQHEDSIYSFNWYKKMCMADEEKREFLEANHTYKLTEFGKLKCDERVEFSIDGDERFAQVTEGYIECYLRDINEYEVYVPAVGMVFVKDFPKFIKSTESTRYQREDNVLEWSERHSCYCPGEFKYLEWDEVERSHLIQTGGLPEPEEHRFVEPQYLRMDYPAQPANTVRPAFEKGADVEVFAKKHQKWIPATVTEHKPREGKYVIKLVGRDTTKCVFETNDCIRRATQCNSDNYQEDEKEQPISPMHESETLRIPTPEMSSDLSGPESQSEGNDDVLALEPANENAAVQNVTDSNKGIKVKTLNAATVQGGATRTRGYRKTIYQPPADN